MVDVRRGSLERGLERHPHGDAEKRHDEDRDGSSFLITASSGILLETRPGPETGGLTAIGRVPRAGETGRHPSPVEGERGVQEEHAREVS